MIEQNVQVPAMSDMLTPLSPLAPGDWYKPSLPQRGCSAEPHYSVPRNNARVEIRLETNLRGEEVDKTPTNEAGRMLDTLEKVKQSFTPFNK